MALVCYALRQGTTHNFERMSQAMTPMLVQYLVALCCLRHDPDAVDITIGDMVLDASADKVRDVDVTVTIQETDGKRSAFKAYEVKREGKPLDVSVVEQLCVKLMDMPSITHRAIVSSSGFSSGAVSKASSHGVELYELKPWTRPLKEQFPLLQMGGLPQDHFRASQSLLSWSQWRLSLVAHDAKGPFTVSGNDAVLMSDGGQHARFNTFSEYWGEILLRSTEVLYLLDPAQQVLNTFPVPFRAQTGVEPFGPAWPHTHTLDVAKDEVHVRTQGGGIVRLDSVTINGSLRWERGNEPEYYVVERVSDRSAFASALIMMELREGHFTALVFSPTTRDIHVQFVRLAEKHRNFIRELGLHVAMPRL